MREIQRRVLTLTGFDVSPTSLCSYLQIIFSGQKIKLVAKQRDEDLRNAYKSEVSLYSLIFMDETGTDRRDGLRKYGYSLRGKTPQFKTTYENTHKRSHSCMNCYKTFSRTDLEKICS